jgi:phosphate:Na+ symporter
MEILHEINPALEALAYLGSRANGHTLDRLEERFLLHPALALEQSRQVTDAMAQRAMDNLLRAMELVHRFSDKGCQAVEDTEDAIDRYEDRLGTYLMKITGKELSQRQSEEVSKYLHTISDFERISDHALNICDAAREINAKSVVFSPEADRELRMLEQAVTEILHLSVGAFVNGDLESAGRVEPLEEIIDGLCDEMKLHHVDRLQKGVCTLNQGFIFNDLLTNYERVADHCSNIAVAMIELESDSFDTHEYLNSVKAMKSASFARYSAEYQKKYTL